MLKTSVRKYYISLGKGNINNEDPFVNFIFRGAKIFTFKGFLYHPWIRINGQGFKAVKCPDISGTWLNGDIVRPQKWLYWVFH